MAVASTSMNVPLASRRAPEEPFAGTSQAVSSANVRTATKANRSERAVSKKPQLHPVAALKILARPAKFASRPTRRRHPAVAFASVPEAGSATRRPVCVVTSTNVWNLQPISQPAATRPSVKIYLEVTTVPARTVMKAIRSRAARFAIPWNADVNHRTKWSEEPVCWLIAPEANRLVQPEPNASP